MSDHAVHVADASKIFNRGRPNEVVALTGIDLAIDPGEFVTLIGPSGCGKSTLLRLIAALIPPMTGDITVNGKTADQARRDQDYGMAVQRAGLFDWRSVSRNIELPLELMGWSRDDRRTRAAEMLELVCNNADCPAQNISGLCHYLSTFGVLGSIVSTSISEDE